MKQKEQTKTVIYCSYCLWIACYDYAVLGKITVNIIKSFKCVCLNKNLGDGQSTSDYDV